MLKLNYEILCGLIYWAVTPFTSNITFGTRPKLSQKGLKCVNGIPSRILLSEKSVAYWVTNQCKQILRGRQKGHYRESNVMKCPYTEFLLTKTNKEKKWTDEKNYMKCSHTESGL